MKKVIISFVILGIYFYGWFEMVFATTFDPAVEIPAWTPKAADAYESLRAGGAGTTNYDKAEDTYQPRDNSSPNDSSSWWPTTVTVTEKIPGMKCDGADNQPITTRKYVCTIQPGFWSIMLILKGLIKYATFITALIGVLMLVVSGIQYSIAGADKWAADAAKKRIEKVIAGIILLFLIGFILNSIAPWVYR